MAVIRPKYEDHKEPEELVSELTVRQTVNGSSVTYVNFPAYGCGENDNDLTHDIVFVEDKINGVNIYLNQGPLEFYLKYLLPQNLVQSDIYKNIRERKLTLPINNFLSLKRISIYF